MATNLVRFELGGDLGGPARWGVVSGSGVSPLAGDYATTAALIERGTAAMQRLFDERHGGFGHEPKFPHPAAVELLLSRWWDGDTPRFREMVERTLTGMAEGGMYDQIGGGFHRYSVDERWRVPHFEKMAYDNAELLKAYLHAWAALGVPLFRETAEGIVAWSLEVLADRERGGFAASQDADVGLDDDGDYFTWTVDEARGALTAEEWEAARRRWDIEETGEMTHDSSRNVLWVARSIAAIAQELQVTALQVEDLLRGAKRKLKAARARRPAPGVDRAVYVSWNAMMAEAFLEAGAVLARPDCTEHALRTLERLWAEAVDPAGGLRHRADRGSGPVLLDDQVQAASAACAAYEHTGDERWLERARTLMAFATVHFEDHEHGGFFDAAPLAAAGLLDQRAKPIQDAPTPAPNAVAALVLLKLAAVTDEPSLAATAERTVAAFAGAAADLGLFAATYLRALDWLLGGASKIVVADTTTASDLRSVALAVYRPRKAVAPTATSPVRGVAAPVALVCAGTACAAPVRDGASLRRTLETFGRAG